MGIDNAIVGVITTIITQLLKKAPMIPMNSGEKAKIRSIVLVLSGIVTLSVAYLDGSLGSEALQPVVTDIVLNTLMAFGFYNALS